MKTLPTIVLTIAILVAAGAASAQAPDMETMKKTCQAAANLPVSQRAESLRDLARAERQAFHLKEQLYELDTSNILVGDKTQPAWTRVRDYYLTAKVDGSIYVTHTEGAKSTNYNYKGTLAPKVAQAFQNPADRSVVDDAVLRAGLYDTPWSAAFISAMMINAGFTRDQWTPAAAHSSYIEAALTKGHAEGANYAYVACDPDWVRPRVGDLICYARATTSPKSFSEVVDRVTKNRGGYESHCDIVTSSDPTMKAMTSIGGNVKNTVYESDRKFGVGATATLSTVAGQKWIAALILARPGG